MVTDEAHEISILREEIKRLRGCLNRLTPSLSVMLRRRGFQHLQKEPPADLIVPDKQFIDGYYENAQEIFLPYFPFAMLSNTSPWSLSRR